jgi:hypothetical protein
MPSHSPPLAPRLAQQQPSRCCRSHRAPARPHPPPPLQGAKPADRLAKGEVEGATYDFEDKINFAVFPSLQVQGRLI